MTWQPIETAPKDGTPILLVGTDGDRSICWWQRPNPHGWASAIKDHPGGWADDTLDDAGFLDEYRVFTHWQPLPPPPEAA